MSRSLKLDVLRNFVMNFFSYSLPTFVLQFVVQPIIAKKIGSDLNGQYLTLMSLNYFLVAITANVLNTVRLLQNAIYEKKGYSGDFNIFLSIYACLFVLVLPLGYCFFCKKVDILDITLYIIIGLLYLYHDYIFAQYRIQLNFKKILINNGVLVFGYLIGIALFLYVIQKWQIIIITSYLFGGVFDYYNTTFIREPLVKTPLFRITAQKIGSLTCANALNSSISYFDKLLLYPLLGGSQVSVYNTASLVGKMLILISAPLNSFVLSYLVRMNTIKIKIQRKYLVGAIGLLTIVYLGCVLIGYPLTNLLYPDWARESQQFIPITVAASLFTLVGNLLNTIIIRFYKTSYQIAVQGANLALYLVLSLSFLYKWGLFGFSIGVATVAFIKMIVLAVVIRFSHIQEKSND